MSKLASLEDLYVEQLKDLYSAETQLIKALPEMAKASHAPDLKAGFQEHLEQTREHAERLEQILEALDEKPTGNKCEAMAGLIKEGKKTIGEDASPAVRDAALIAAAQRVEHYEIAGYGCVRTYAKLLGDDQASEVLQTTLDEEAETDEKLTGLSENLNVKAENLSSRRQRSK